MRALGALLGLALLLGRGEPAPGAEAPRLRSLLAGARWVAVGRVAAITPYDDGRVVTVRLQVTELLKGRDLGGEVLVVEMRDLASRPPVFEEGDLVVAFLGQASRNTYLANTVPRANYLEASRGRDGVLRTRDPETARQVADVVRRLADESRNPERDPVERAAARRALVFDEIGSRHPALVEEGAASLAELPEIAGTLTPEENRRIGSALQREDLPPRVRVALTEGVANAGLVSMIPTLAALRPSSADVLEATWNARTRLGSPPSAAEITGRLRDPDPAVRTAAARVLAAQGGAVVLPEVSRVALTDPDPEVRVAAIEALGRESGGDVMPTLEKAFGDPAWPIRQAAGRAIYGRGGREAAEAFAKLAFESQDEAGRKYAVTLLMALGLPADDPLRKRIVASHPDAAVREIAEHGLPFHEH